MHGDQNKAAEGQCDGFQMCVNLCSESDSEINTELSEKYGAVNKKLQ